MESQPVNRTKELYIESQLYKVCKDLMEFSEEITSKHIKQGLKKAIKKIEQQELDFVLSKINH